ncbi:hypothetical protein GGS23DRAFT_572022 [Durotheca rogersii]|uniref:uncharacterized protein n=1 Tax=Durotheca rogersii TaxID=419775 RepID=UPI00221FDD45|nr:uncharacterized protein GGS23DRAFT_572022 [Durotheca rogersii]KAI5862357.1 hypothetical protein GGS23DRAFT_572022 [Durotheca rogersii]
MPPELRKRKSKEAVISAPKSVPRVKAVTPATKRKALDDASPVLAKKPKPIKDGSRSQKVKISKEQPKETKPSKKAQRAEEEVEEKGGDEPNGADDSAPPSDDEQDNARALAKVVDSDGEEDDIADTEIAFKKGQDVGKIPEVSEKPTTSAQSPDGGSGVVYVGHLPHGFYEHEMRSYFSQFGKVTRLRMSRNKKTGASKHFAFIKFAEAPVAKVVADTMDNYLLFGRVLKVKVVPKSQIHEDLWKGSNRRFKAVPWNKMAGNQLKKPISESGWAQKIAREQKKRDKRAKKLLEIGYEFEGPNIKSIDEVERDPAVLEDGDRETPKAIEAAPEIAPEKAEADTQLAEKVAQDDNSTLGGDLSVEKPAEKGTVTASRKAKKSKTKKTRS